MPDDPGRECAWCDRGWAAIGIVTGLLIVVIGVDLATGGRLAGAVFRQGVTGADDAV
jgi:hypothetical protein